MPSDDWLFTWSKKKIKEEIEKKRIHFTGNALNSVENQNSTCSHPIYYRFVFFAFSSVLVIYRYWFFFAVRSIRST